jgi:hypothetical protein
MCVLITIIIIYIILSFALNTELRPSYLERNHVLVFYWLMFAIDCFVAERDLILMTSDYDFDDFFG